MFRNCSNTQRDPWLYNIPTQLRGLRSGRERGLGPFPPPHSPLTQSHQAGILESRTGLFFVINNNK